MSIRKLKRVTKSDNIESKHISVVKKLRYDLSKEIFNDNILKHYVKVCPLYPATELGITIFGVENIIKLCRTTKYNYIKYLQSVNKTVHILRLDTRNIYREYPYEDIMSEIRHLLNNTNTNLKYKFKEMIKE